MADYDSSMPLPTPSVSSALPGGAATQNLLLDSSIRDWVVLPLLVIMIAAGLLRHYLGQLLRANSKTIPYIDNRAKGVLQRASRLRGGAGGFLSRSKWEARRRQWSAREGGYLREEADWCADEKEEPSEHGGKDGGDSGVPDMANPMGMMEGMKGNMAAMVQNMVMMQGISHFFRGYVLVRVPFPLTRGFKMMFQRGLDLTTLDTSYVSSVSWYFLVMFGLRAFFRLAIGEPVQEVQESHQIQHGLGLATNVPPGPQQFDAPKMLRTEAENLELARYRPNVDDAERRLLGKRYPKKKVGKFGAGGTGSGSDLFTYGMSSHKGGKTTKKKKAT